MKIRMGFVSNSSSSSFVCDVCGEEASGWDIGLDEADMAQCQGDHTFCNEHVTYEIEDLITKEFLIDQFKDSKYEDEREMAREIEAMTEEEFKENIEDLREKHAEIDEFFTGEIPSEACPICQLKVLCQSEEVAYLSKTSGISKADVFTIVKAENKRRKKLYDREYINYVNEKKETNSNSTLKEVQEKFKNYDEFFKFINS